VVVPVNGHHRGVAQYETAGAGGSGERWNVNLPAVIGVVFVFLVGVIVWVVARGGGDDPVATTDTTTIATTTTTGGVTGGDGTTSLTTTPAPMPDPVPPTSAPTTDAPDATDAPSTTVAVTSAPDAGPDAVPGDLGIPGRPMQRPGCDDSFITILASAIGDQATATGIASVLEAFPGSEYLRTDQTCSSLRPDVDGAPIYVVYLGPFAFASDACAAQAQGPDGAYAKQLSNDIPPDRVVDCS
jgi:hypothetical protein